MTSSYNHELTHLLKTIEKLVERLSSLRPSSLEQITLWRTAAYRSIDDYCEQKRHEIIERRQTQQTKELDYLRHKIDQLIDEHDESSQDKYSSIKHDIQLAEIKINELEHLRLTLHPLSIDEQFIVRRRLFPLPHSYRTIDLRAGLQSAVGTNDKHLLVDREGKHLCLLNQDLTIIKETPFRHDGIHSVCWASSIRRFIIVTFKEILLLDENTMTLKTCPIKYEAEWWRGTCSDDILFLSTVEWGTSIYEYNIRSRFEAVKEWHAPVTCKSEEIICDIKYNNGYLATPIFNKHKDESRFELRSVLTLQCIWSIRAHERCRCCSIDVDQWLLMDHDDCRFFHISADGKLLEVDKYDENERLEDIIPWGKDNIAILTKKHINLHRIN